MKKYSLLSIAAAMLLALVCSIAALAEIVPPDGPGQQIGYQAAVLCETLTLRERPDSSSKAVATLHYGDLPIVVGADLPAGPQEENGFVYCVLGDSEDSPSGWINAGFLAVNPAWYVTEQKTTVYAWNGADAPKVALLDEGARLPILKEEGDWFLVSLRGAVGWISR